MKTLQRGDVVEITAAGRTVKAMVALATPNGRAIILLFDGMIGAFLAVLPLSLLDDGTWAAYNGMPAALVLDEARP